MKDALSDAFIWLVALLLFLVGPVYVSYQSIDNMIYQEVRAATNDFQKEVRKDGYVDLNNYNVFLNRLNSTEKVYDVQIIHTSKLVYPNTSVSEGFSIEHIDHGNKEVIPTIYNNQKYLMKYGDDFKVEVSEKVPGYSSMLMGLVTAQPTIQTQFWVDGGMVQNQAF